MLEKPGQPSKLSHKDITPSKSKESEQPAAVNSDLLQATRR